MTAHPQPVISVVIPVLNETGNLERCLTRLPAGPAIEVIVSDGGSTDDSAGVALGLGAQVVPSEQGRAKQMNAGADVATGEVLIFLHADTQLTENAATLVRQALSEGYAMGCFERVFDSDHPLLRRTSRWAGWRARNYFLAYGDQAIFIRRDLFEKLGGYREMKRFEDLDLTRRARRHGRWTVLPGPIITDARRFGKSPLKRVLADAWLTIAWLTGMIKE